MATVVKDLGAVTAYAYAVAGGYSGTEAEFEALLGNIAEDLSEIENLSVTVTTLPAGSSATASYNNGVLSLGIPKGDKGDKGDTGATGATGATGPQGIPGDVANLASAYSTSSTYGVGDYCIYNSQLYRCNTAITTAEAWTAAHWTAAVMGDDVSNLKSATDSLNNNFIYRLVNGFDKDNTQSGYYGSNGSITADANYVSSLTYAIVYPGTVYKNYYSTGKAQYTVVLWYDKEKQFLSRNTGNGADFTAPSGAAYARVSAPAPNAASTIFTEFPFTEYSGFGYVVALNQNVQTPFLDSNPLYGKKLSVTGDSLCYGEGYTGGYAKIIGEENNMTVQNIGVSGGTIVNKSGAFCISESVANMDSDSDYAIIEGGFNDAASRSAPPIGTIAAGYNATYDTTTFCGAFETMLRNLLIRFHGKKIGYIAVHQATNNYRIVNDEATSYYWAARRCCEKWGVPFCDINATAPAFGFFTETNADMLAIKNAYTLNGDGTHPNELCYRKYYAPKIEAWMKTL